MTLRNANTPLEIAGRRFRSRLILGTGKFPDFETMRRALEASGAEIVTVAVRRVDRQEAGHVGLLEALDLDRYWLLPNTAGCRTAEEAVRVARLGRALVDNLGQEGNNWVKLEVIPDPKYLLPDPVGTLEAARELVADGFVVLPYLNDDPVLARKLEEVGAATVMPLAAPIGSGQGLVYFGQIAIMVEQCTVPVIVDAGLGAPSDAALAMEIGVDACLVNTAIAKAQHPVAMAEAFRLGIEAGQLARKAGRIPKLPYASASSPLEGVVR
jgi:thiazole synthase